jgi:lipopolysaccharide export LptBFGC system permease protein LptF
VYATILALFVCLFVLNKHCTTLVTSAALLALVIFQLGSHTFLSRAALGYSHPTLASHIPRAIAMCYHAWLVC